MVPDLSTLRRLSWQEKTALVLCDVKENVSHELVAEAPRSVLLGQLQRARTLGFEAMAASELEYYLFEDSYRQAAAKHYQDLSPAGGYIEDYHVLQGFREEGFHGAVRRHLRDSGVPVEGSKGEWGPGQHELNVRYSDILTMADRHCVYKECLKEVAEQMGLSVTFMAKYASELAGSSCHVHLSLWRDGGNAFAGNGGSGRILRGVPLVPRGMADASGRDHGVLRTHHQRLQALPGGVLGAHRASPGATTTALPGSGW